MTRIPLNTLAISLGLAGLAEIWGTAGRSLGWSNAVAEGFWLLVVIVWLLTTVAHAIRAWRSEDSLASQLRHPVEGPVAAIWPIVGMAMGANLHQFWAAGGELVVIVSVIASALFAAWLLAHMMSGQLKLESVHGGYFLPVAAASFVAAAVLPASGLPDVAVGCFFLGVFFWIFTFTLLFARLAFGGPVAAPLVPTLAVMAAPPAVAGAAWFAIAGSRLGTVDYWLAASAVLMLLVQLALLPRYLKLPFTLGFWSFTFPFAYSGVYAIQWLDIVRPPGWQPEILVLLAAVTALIATIAGKSIALALRDRASSRRDAENKLNAADERMS
ncbi:MAG: putative transporter [Microbacteriaceae bacterium]|nr:putative transporter [Microbacteriaceae bacterium]